MLIVKVIINMYKTDNIKHVNKFYYAEMKYANYNFRSTERAPLSV